MCVPSIREKWTSRPDYQGVVYVSLDDANKWKRTLARELKAAGIPGKFADILN